MRESERRERERVRGERVRGERVNREGSERKRECKHELKACKFHGGCFCCLLWQKYDEYLALKKTIDKAHEDLIKLSDQLEALPQNSTEIKVHKSISHLMHSTIKRAIWYFYTRFVIYRN